MMPAVSALACRVPSDDGSGLLAQGIGGGKLLAPVPVPYVPVVSEVFLGPTQWEGVGAAPEMVHKVTQPPATNDNLS